MIRRSRFWAGIILLFSSFEQGSTAGYRPWRVSPSQTFLAEGGQDVFYWSMGQATPGRHYLALVVDDDESVRNFVREILQEHGFEVYVAEDGKTAASLYKKHADFSLVVTDILMPAGDGIDFILKIRTGVGGAAQPKIIAISGGGFIDAEEYLESARGLGADVTLEKPFSTHDLTEALLHLGFEST
jgi:CheY-like chemotaxis protein